MFEASSFDSMAKSAEKFQKILSNSSAMKILNDLASQLTTNLKNGDKQAERMLARISKLRDITKDLAMKEAKTTKEILTRVKLYDQELDKIKKSTKAAKDQLAIQQQQSQNSKLSAQQRMRATSMIASLTAKIAENEEAAHRWTALRAVDKAIVAKQNKQAAKEFITKEFGGGIIGQLGDLFKALRGLGILLGVLGGVFLLLKSIIGPLRDGLKTSIELGLDSQQRWTQIQKATQIIGRSLQENHNILDISDTLKAMDALSAKLGTLSISSKLIQTSAELSRQLGISADEAGNLLEFFTRIRQESAITATTSAYAVKATAILNNVNAALVMRDVASNAANWAKSSKTSATELAKSAILVRQMGTTLATVANIADNIVTNFEGTLEAQASIGAFAPGFDMTGLLVASQFGTDTDIANQLKIAVDSLGMDFDSMPRSFKLAISQGLGLTVDELAKIAHAQTGPQLTPDTQAIIDSQKGGLNELQQAMIDPLNSIKTGVFGIWSLLARIFGSPEDREAVAAAKAAVSATPQTSAGPIINNVTSPSVQAASQADVAASLDNFTRTMADYNNQMRNRPFIIKMNGKEIGKGIIDAHSRGNE